jgi:hypothetical protein
MSTWTPVSAGSLSLMLPLPTQIVSPAWGAPAGMTMVPVAGTAGLLIGSNVVHSRCNMPPV